LLTSGTSGPPFFHLIEQCRPAVVLGEQVASKDADPWIDLVHDDLEAVGYAFGAVPFPSAGVGAPHIRDRLYWAASDGVVLDDTIGKGLERFAGYGDDGHEPGRLAARAAGPTPAAGRIGELEHAAGGGFAIIGSTLGARNIRHADGAGDAPCGMADTDDRHVSQAGRGPIGRAGQSGSSEEREATGPINGYWRIADWLFCRDGKWRPVEPGTFPLAHGATSRVGRLRAYGNAINAEVAHSFIEASKHALASSGTPHGGVGQR
jgi:DNA (cytosine-5)-methyltransferase 1